jgi:hypothetical protein
MVPQKNGNLWKPFFPFYLLTIVQDVSAFGKKLSFRTLISGQKMQFTEIFKILFLCSIFDYFSKYEAAGFPGTPDPAE